MSTHLTRKELKQDQFTAGVENTVEHTVDYFTAHRSQIIRYGAIAGIAIVIVAAVWYVRGAQASSRQQALGEAMTLFTAPVGNAQPTGGVSFPNEAAKETAVAKAFTSVAADYNGSEEGYIAEYYLAGKSTDAGKLDDARKKYQDVADHASANYASLAKLALSQIDLSENRTAEAEKILKDLMDHPTDLVSKTQATIAYAKAITPSRPEEARKILEPIAGTPSDVSPIAAQAISELPQK